MDPLRTPDGLELVSGWQDELAGFYAEPPRSYHTLEHVQEVLGHYWREDWSHPHEVFCAVLFHDAIYVPGAKDNEDRSADLARETLPRWTAQDLDLAYVDRLIRLTARHGHLTPADVSEEEARFLDCDMAILAASDEAFATYDAGVRREYAFLPPEVYAAGRRAFVRGLLDEPRIFLSDPFHDRYDARARVNLRSVLAG